MIKTIKAQEILDSRGNPTVAVELITDFGIFQASVPSGASKGKYEAVELRDGGERYQGRGVLKAVKNVNEKIGPKLKGKDVRNQKKIDQILIELDGTKNKSKLGANAILPVSMAVCRAGAKAKNIPLWQHLKNQYDINSTAVRSVLSLPTPCFNIINGGAHAGNELDIQEFMVVPQINTFKKALQQASEIYHTLREILIKDFGRLAINVGDEGGFAPPLYHTQEALNLIMKAIKESNYREKTKIGLDCAASQFFKKENYKLDKTIFTGEGLLTFYQEIVKKYPILFIEDPFAEEDWQGWRKLKVKSEKLKVLIIGDDLLATNPMRMEMAKERNACNAAIVKPNQIGTVTETLEAAKLAKSFGWKIMVSHRSGETNDDFIADLAVGISADFIKSGAPARGERVAKYNRLLKIEEEIKR